MIKISELNDFVFCPYSIYLHNIYSDVNDELIHDSYQTVGKIAHKTVDNNSYKLFEKDCLTSLNVYSEEFGLCGIIDIFNQKTGELIERKNKLKKIYQGQIYQVWAQYFCLREMGYSVSKITMLEVSTTKRFNIDLPTKEDEYNFKHFIEQFRNFNPQSSIEVNPNKCQFCIYAALCDKR